jgi:hypothetical protein
MKATIDIPDDVYRKVKAKSALEGRPVRDVTVQLFRQWLDEARGEPSGGQDLEAVRERKPPWLGALKGYAKNARGRHDMESVRDSIARARGRREDPFE